MVIPFTDRQIEKAWRENKSASEKTPRTNAHRLLLFYAVECGLKAILMRRQGKSRSDLCRDISECQHDVNKLLAPQGGSHSFKSQKSKVLYIKAFTC